MFSVFVLTLLFLQIRLLKDILEAWKKEVEKKPSTLTVDEAYDVLKVKRDPSGQVQTLCETQHAVARESTAKQLSVIGHILEFSTQA